MEKEKEVLGQWQRWMKDDWNKGKDGGNDGGLEEEKDDWDNDRDGGMRTGTRAEMEERGLGQ